MTQEEEDEAMRKAGNVLLKAKLPGGEEIEFWVTKEEAKGNFQRKAPKP